MAEQYGAQERTDGATATLVHRFEMTATVWEVLAPGHRAAYVYFHPA